MLRELGNKVKNMEKLEQTDILYEVHEAAEELQQKIDKKSYLLVNSKRWEIGSQPREESPQELLNMDEERKFLEHKSLSEAVLDLRSVEVSESWDDHLTGDANPTLLKAITSENMFRKQIYQPASINLNTNAVTEEEESKTYESASALSLSSGMI